MIKSLETETLTFGEDDEFHRRLNEFCRFYLERMRIIPWVILRIPCNCWNFLIYLARSIIQLFLRQFIAVIVLVLSASTLPGSIIILRGSERIVIAVYCLSFLACSILSLFFKKGSIRFVLKNRRELLENQLLLAESNRRNGQADLPAGYGTRDKREPLQKTSENLKEPRPESETVHAFDFKRSSSYEPLNCCDEISAGPSHAPECANRFTVTHISDDSYDSDEPPKRLSVANISAVAVKTFGPPLQVFGADSYQVVWNSSDEDIFSDDSNDVGVQNFEFQAEVHHSDSYKPLNSFNEGSSSAEPASVANNESAVMIGSDLSSNLTRMDDQSSEPSCSSSQNKDKDERSA